MFIIDLAIVVALVTLSGLFSGLTLGLMSLKPHEIRRKMRLGSKYAKRIYPLRKNGNQLLCTLLLGNVLVNAILSIYLGSITAGVIAAIVATALITVFGEILPQALFSRYAMKFGAKTAWITESFLFLFYPVTWPLSKGLDKLLGKELPAKYSKKELGFILEEHVGDTNTELDDHEVRILRGTLEFGEKRVIDVMTKRRISFFIDAATILDTKAIQRIQRKGFSRIPVFDKKKDTVVGILFAKDLIILDPDEHIPVTDVMRDDVSFIGQRTRLDDVLLRFQERRIHLFIVRDKQHKITGIITLEDVLEELVGEIEDEHD